VIKCVQEPSIEALRDQVRNASVEIIPGSPGVGGSKSNDLFENAVDIAQG